MHSFVHGNFLAVLRSLEQCSEMQHTTVQVPEELHARNGTLLNKDNIYITKTTPSFVVKCFQEQFHKDFSLFLKLRHEELVYGGKMVLTFVGRKDEDVYDGDTNQFYGLLARSLQSLVAKISKRGTYKVSFTFFCVV